MFGKFRSRLRRSPKALLFALLTFCLLVAPATCFAKEPFCHCLNKQAPLCPAAWLACSSRPGALPGSVQGPASAPGPRTGWEAASMFSEPFSSVQASMCRFCLVLLSRQGDSPLVQMRVPAERRPVFMISSQDDRGGRSGLGPTSLVSCRSRVSAGVPGV